MQQPFFVHTYTFYSIYFLLPERRAPADVGLLVTFTAQQCEV